MESACAKYGQPLLLLRPTEFYQKATSGELFLKRLLAKSLLRLVHSVDACKHSLAGFMAGYLYIGSYWLMGVRHTLMKRKTYPQLSNARPQVFIPDIDRAPLKADGSNFRELFDK